MVFGCAIAELFTAQLLFSNDSQMSLLTRIVELCGEISVDMILQSISVVKVNSEVLDREGVDNFVQYKSYAKNYKTSLREYLMDGNTFIKEKYCESMQQQELNDLIDFMENLLIINPKKRISAKEVLKHQWIN